VIVCSKSISDFSFVSRASCDSMLLSLIIYYTYILCVTWCVCMISCINWPQIRALREQDNDQSVDWSLMSGLLQLVLYTVT